MKPLRKSLLIFVCKVCVNMYTAKRHYEETKKFRKGSYQWLQLIKGGGGVQNGDKIVDVISEGWREWGKFTEVDQISISLLSLFFSDWNVVIFPVCEKLLTELNLDIACIAGSNQHIVNPNFEATRCTGIYLW